MDLLIKGIILGFVIAVPVGPIGLLCIRRTLIDGKKAGLISGLGAATADAVGGFIAVSGLTIVSEFLLHHKEPIRLFGSIFLFYIAIKIFRTKSNHHLDKKDAKSGDGREKKDTSMLHAFVTTFFLTITNPATILSFIAFYATLDAGLKYNNYEIVLSVLGVFLGSTIWWVFLSSFFSLFNNKFSNRGMNWLNKISGVLIVALALFSVLM